MTHEHESCAFCHRDLGLSAAELERMSERGLRRDVWDEFHKKRWRCGRCRRLFCDDGLCPMADRDLAMVGVPGGVTIRCCPLGFCTNPDAGPTL